MEVSATIGAEAAAGAEAGAVVEGGDEARAEVVVEVMAVIDRQIGT